MVTKLQQLAEACGLASTYVSEQGAVQNVPESTLRHLLGLLGIDVEGKSGGAPAGLRRALKAEPTAERCHVPGFLGRGRCWGLTCQLYSLVSRRNWGIGDFDDLARLAEIVSTAGGDFVGVNPLHALFPNDPERCSPYSPSSRRFLNVLYIAPDIEPEFDQIERLPLDRLRRGATVNYAEVGKAKLHALDRMHLIFRARADEERRRKFEAFRSEGGEALARHSLFEALSEAFGPAPWWEWPEPYSRPDSDAVRRFRAEHDERIAFHAWLQWLADRQLARAQARARAAGMRIGLYLDLAVGVAPDGAAAWADPQVMVRGAHIGAPPDAFHAGGQDWGLTPQSPAALVERRFEPLASDLAAGMRRAGAIRIDHAMALERLYWVPAGASPTEGGYVHYPLSAMLATVARQSRQWRCLVIGEALGTVPAGFTAVLSRAEVHAYRVMMFEQRRDGSFRAPGSYPRRALACFSTHDLPTLRGWWLGRDIDWRLKLNFITTEEGTKQRRRRERERRALRAALVSQGLLSSDSPARGVARQTVVAVHRYLAASPARLVGVQLEDATGEEEQANLPGPSDPHPNWRRKLPVSLEELPAHPLFRAVSRAMAADRPRR